jgi:gliding motility-associated lipoprotein GldH
MIHIQAIKKTFCRFIAAAILFAAFLACNHKVVTGEYSTIKQANWHKDSTVVFHIPVSDTIKNHSLYINVRNDINYKYSNLWLFIELAPPRGNQTVIDTFEITLADERGKWLGEGFGGVKTLESVYKQNVFFPASGDYQLSIKQGMRDNRLKGITEIGFRLEKE